MKFVNTMDETVYRLSKVFGGSDIEELMEKEFC
jgi:hypothetical protein